MAIAAAAAALQAHGLTLAQREGPVDAADWLGRGPTADDSPPILIFIIAFSLARSLSLSLSLIYRNIYPPSPSP